MSVSLFGQWIGVAEGSNRGFLTVNAEHRFPGLARISFADYDPRKISFYATLKYSFKDSELTGELTDFLAFDHVQNRLANWKDLVAEYGYDPNACPQSGELKADLTINNNSGIDALVGTWSTNIGTRGGFNITRNRNQVSLGATDFMTWEQFKLWACNDGAGRATIYRGQENPLYLLKTTFHRTGRTDLVEYDRTNVPELRHFINALSKYNYQTASIEDYSALLSLAQHHGYPTPLLDWSESPFVAAYFAYENLPKNIESGNVRVYAFNAAAWIGRVNAWQVSSIGDPRPTITIHKAAAHNNKRAMPQQSVSTFTNIEDMEFFIRLIGHLQNPRVNYLRVIDLPRIDRNKAMAELRLMGITAGSLFPDFDGVCKSLRELHF